LFDSEKQEAWAAFVDKSGTGRTRTNEMPPPPPPRAAPVSAVDVLRARQLDIVTSEGKTLLTLGADADGGRLEVKSKLGKTVLVGTADTDGSGLLLVGSASEKAIIRAGAGRFGGSLQVLDHAGEPLCTLEVEETNTGRIGAWNREGKGRALTPAEGLPGPTILPVPSPDGLVESRIDGSFDGFENGRLYKLQNGQIWEQTSFDMSIAVRLSPEVLIYKSGAVWKMKVDSQDRTPTVRRLR
jgi:hypothetical protein